jgi:integrase
MNEQWQFTNVEIPGGTSSIGTANRSGKAPNKATSESPSKLRQLARPSSLRVRSGSAIKQAPTLAEVAEHKFVPDLETRKKSQPGTIEFYKFCIERLKTFPRLWCARLDGIEPEDITAYISVRQALGMATATINHDLATLRRIFNFALDKQEIKNTLKGPLPKVKLLDGENRRERVVFPDEEEAYLQAAAPLLRDFAVLEFDCGLRPDEAHRLKWIQIRNGNVEIHKGKSEKARRSIPASQRVLEMLMRRREQAGSSVWVFPAPTKTGHINQSSLRKQHAAAIKAAEIQWFVVYSLRHTCLTRWAESGMDVYRLQRLAGHEDISTTMRYVHMNDAGDREAMTRVWEVQGRHKTGHSPKSREYRQIGPGKVTRVKSAG